MSDDTQSIEGDEQGGASDRIPDQRVPGPCPILRQVFFQLIVRPIAIVVLGLNVRHYKRLPMRGPALIVANHNSHLDALVLATLWPPRSLRHVRPVAAADYFFRNKVLRWFALRIAEIIPLNRSMKSVRTDPLAHIAAAVERGDIIILFPEGSRGEPERLDRFKTGVAHIAKRFPELPCYPLFMHGFGKALPRGEALLVPFFCDIFVGEPFAWQGDRQRFMDELTRRMTALAEEGSFLPWD